MRDFFENPAVTDPTEAARRGTRPALRRRFYQKATIVPAGSAYAVRLDDRPVRTPAGRTLAAPTPALAEAIAAEWDAQADMIDPRKMPLTRLANAIIDGVVDRPGAVTAEIAKYLGTDLVCYRASGPQGLAERQSRNWDGILLWAREALGARLKTVEGVTHVTQPVAALAAAEAAIPADPWRLGAVHTATTLTGSALIALALAQGQIDAEAAWQAAHVDENWNIEQWGSDEIAQERRAFQRAEFQAAATVLRLL
jgi:chaperone required for assembly of F1-ATPase